MSSLAHAEPSATTPRPNEDASARAVRLYCTNMRDRILDARYAWQKQKLEKLDAELAAKTKALNIRIAEHRKWFQLRESFAKRARGTLVDVLAKMRPDAAAAQLSAMPDLTAASLILKLKPRQASAIMNEMQTAKAATLAGLISDAAGRTAAGGGS